MFAVTAKFAHNNNHNFEIRVTTCSKQITHTYDNFTLLQIRNSVSIPTTIETNVRKQHANQQTKLTSGNDKSKLSFELFDQRFQPGQCVPNHTKLSF